MAVKISIVVIAKNEEKMLPACLKTTTWASEVLVVDTGSTDRTVSIAKKHGARVVEYTTGKHFSEWRNKGLIEADGEWIFYLDADERIPKELAREIQKVASLPEAGHFAYAVPRQNFVLGRELRHGGFYPDYQKRLFRKAKLNEWKGEVHEEPVFEGEIGHLSNRLIHNKHENIAEMVQKTNNWSEIEAKLMLESGHPPMNVLRFVSAMFREFWHRMIVKRAFLDGKVGIIFACYQVFSRFTSYAKLWELQQNEKQT